MTQTRPAVLGTVEREDTGRVAVLTLKREGRANAWGPDMAGALLEHLAAIEADDATTACVITGDGDRAFSSGADLGSRSAHQSTSAGSVLRNMTSGTHAVFDALARFPKPMICAVNGLAIGAGFLIALHCDVVLASENAEFSLPQVALGVLPAYGGIYRLATWVGRGRASELVLSGRRLGAGEAAELGLVSAVCARSDLAKVAMEKAAALAALPPLAVALAKESLRVSFDNPDARIMDQYRFGMLSLTDDCAEAHSAWRERRDPQYRGL